ncbi:uncharacterized protein [Triticum aestivum]|uniref:uncharacterized protein n=1 Tax=Triticum aestivum TaxID=4565 RepID=UPI001D00D9FA|nr:uncharacterized protein LOC123138647 [Triticum aestivum]
MASLHAGDCLTGELSLLHAAAPPQPPQVCPAAPPRRGQEQPHEEQGTATTIGHHRRNAAEQPPAHAAAARAACRPRSGRCSKARTTLQQPAAPSSPPDVAVGSFAKKHLYSFEFHPLSSRRLIHFSCDSNGGFAHSAVCRRRPPPCLAREDGGRSPGGWGTARLGGVVVVACAAETARQGRAVALVDRPSCLAREDGRRSPGRVRRRRLLPRVEVEQQRTGRQGGKVGTLCIRAAFVLHLLQKRALAAGAGGGAAVLARGCAGVRRRRGSRELSSLAAGGGRDRASGRGDRGPWWLPAWRLHEMLLGRGLADSISSTQGPVLVSACPIAHDFSDPAPNSEDHAELDLDALHLMGGRHQERQQQYGLAASKISGNW